MRASMSGQLGASHMDIGHLARGLCVAIFLFGESSASADVQRIYVLEQIDEDHIIIVTETGARFLLAQWTPQFAPLLLEGRYFAAEVSPKWVTIYLPDRDGIKWSIEDWPETMTPGSPTTTQGSMPPKPSGKPSGQGCYESTIRQPSPFLGNGGETVFLSDGTIWKEISYQFLHLWEFNPIVTVCPDEGKMTFEGHVFQIVPAR